MGMSTTGSDTPKTNDDPKIEEMVEFLVHTAALLRMGHIQALSLSFALWGCGPTGRAYLTKDCDRLGLLDKQIDMLDE